MPTKEPTTKSIFEENWAIYRKAIDRNYMSHREIAAQLKELLEGRSGLRILDLGCGDMEITSRFADGGMIEHLTGVDASGAALMEAAARLTGYKGELRLVESDLLRFVRRHSGSYDIIVAGYSIHHLSFEEKEEFFRLTRERLADGGQLLMYDCVRTPGLDRDESIQDYLTWLETSFAEMTEREHELIRLHIEEADFPEEAHVLEEMASSAGYDTGEIINRWDGGRHVLFRFS